MNPFDFRQPDTVEEALTLLHDRGEDARAMAGGTALVIMLKQRLVMPDCLISLQKLRGLDQIDVTNGEIRLGALTTHRAVERSSVVRSRIPALAETYAHVATIRIRNVATVGGALAHADPNQDPPVILLALDAQVRLNSTTDSRQVPIGEFFTDYYETVRQPDELVTEVVVPVPKPHSGSVYLKYLPRTADDYATVGVAATVTIDPATGRCQESRIAMGCVAPTPVRAHEAEALVRGDRLTPELAREAGALAQRVTDPISDARGSAEYKRAMAGVFVRRALEQAWQRAQASGGKG
ncbi:MAG TPA: xanthine dehydrogenase family protein subunit M [Candidatus Tectomicrobia bacterium]|nr:xanthine dehydrogenase family protein subunit M [Candidatus Tectomicrobia bacterium]